ncbi:MAG: potassium transporter KtrB [Lachnospiraceae bacterium]|nr:potassium transporter KtrB [Lachnospiraceae bacterium]
MGKQWKFRWTTTRIIVTGFLMGILIGSFLLWLPISSKQGENISYLDALFVATTSICVTGLSPVVTATQWSYFGQVVILFLMQLGGLGVVTFTTILLLVLGKRIKLSDRLLIQDAYNLNSVAGVVDLTKRIIKGTILVEALGALCYSFVFIPQFGIGEGMWKSVFHAVSAFCNAGLDTVSPDGFLIYRTNVIVNMTTMLLIILGGIGFPVWFDVVRVVKLVIKREIQVRDAFKKTMLYTKLAITITPVLIIVGAGLVFAFEYQNPATLGNLTIGQKVMASFFESVTLRTAGFQTIPQENLTEASNLLALLLMFIGGSPSGTAGGVKTVTIAVLVLSTIATVRGEHEVTAFHRKITDNFVRRAAAVVSISFGVLVLICTILTVTESAEFTDILFESVSAIATVGLTRGLTPNLTMAGKITIIVAMYLGRLGPITMALAFNSKKYEGKKSLAEGKIMIG